MNEKIQNEEGAILAIRGYLQNAREQLSGENTRVKGQIQSWSADWEGESSKAFRGFTDAWDVKFQELIGFMNEFEASLTHVDSTFTQSDDTGGTKFHGLGSTL